MAQQFHLEAGLLGRHRVKLKLLVLHDAEIGLGLILRLVEEEIGEGERGLLFVRELRLVFLDLALNGLFREINRGKKVIGRLFGTDKAVAGRNRDLDNLGILPAAQNNARLGIGSKILLEFSEFFVHLILQSVAQIHVSSANGDTHTVLLLSSLMRVCSLFSDTLTKNAAMLLISV